MNRVASQLVSIHSQRQAASEQCTEDGKHHLVAADGARYFPCPDGSQTSQSTETSYINMIVPAQKTLLFASLDRAENALLDSGSGLTSCPINYANDILMSPRPANLPI